MKHVVLEMEARQGKNVLTVSLLSRSMDSKAKDSSSDLASLGMIELEIYPVLSISQDLSTSQVTRLAIKVLTLSRESTSLASIRLIVV